MNWTTFIRVPTKTFKTLLPKISKISFIGSNNEVKDYAIRDNIEKARHGKSFEDEIKNLLDALQREGVVDRYIHQPVYSGCFRPDFEIHVGDTIIIVDATTTVRTDREKGKLWDAYWAKQILHRKYPQKRVEAITVVQKIEGSERNNFIRAKAYIEKCSRPYGAVDYVMTIEDFVRHLYRLKGLEPPI